jgi:hypothetical protein
MLWRRTPLGGWQTGLADIIIRLRQ